MFICAHRHTLSSQFMDIMQNRISGSNSLCKIHKLQCYFCLLCQLEINCDCYYRTMTGQKHTHKNEIHYNEKHRYRGLLHQLAVEHITHTHTHTHTPKKKKKISFLKLFLKILCPASLKFILKTECFTSLKFKFNRLEKFKSTSSKFI